MKEASEEMIRKKSAMKVQNHKSTKEAANSNGTSSRATDTTAKEARKNEAQAASPYQCNEPEVDSNGRSKVRLVEKANRGKSLLFCAPTFSPPNEVYRCTKKERLADLENPDIIVSTVPVKPILKCENSSKLYCLSSIANQLVTQEGQGLILPVFF